MAWGPCRALPVKTWRPNPAAERANEAGIDLVSEDENILIRCENAGEAAAVRSVNVAAFARDDEADLVERLRREGVVLLSLVAVAGTDVLGHALFSRMWIDAASGPIAAVALAPMAVLPARQRQGMGGQLIRRGLDCLRERGEQIVIVLGHPDYYPRFGFSTQAAQALQSPFPPHAYMAIELSADALAGVSGRVRYPLAFNL